jgi:hypothetical protein
MKGWRRWCFAELGREWVCGMRYCAAAGGLPAVCAESMCCGVHGSAAAWHSMPGQQCNVFIAGSAGTLRCMLPSAFCKSRFDARPLYCVGSRRARRQYLCLHVHQHSIARALRSLAFGVVLVSRRATCTLKVMRLADLSPCAALPHASCSCFSVMSGVLCCVSVCGTQVFLLHYPHYMAKCETFCTRNTVLAIGCIFTRMHSGWFQLWTPTELLCLSVQPFEPAASFLYRSLCSPYLCRGRILLAGCMHDDGVHSSKSAACHVAYALAMASCVSGSVAQTRVTH